MARTATMQRRPVPPAGQKQPDATTEAEHESEGALRAALSTPTITLAQAAACLGISMSKAYRLVESDDFPVPLLRMGRRFRVPSLPLLEKLGYEPTSTRSGVSK